MSTYEIFTGVSILLIFAACIAFVMPSFLTHAKQWLEVYWWLPLSLLSIIGAKWFYYWQTGRSPLLTEGGVSWIVELAPRLVVCILVIALTSIFREAGGVWLTKDERLSNPVYAITQSLIRFGAAILFAYILTH